ncbi:hypothetical protein D3C78_884480 [compost metagenome]
MAIYRLMISRHGKLLGHFESDTPWAEEAARDVAARFPAESGYSVSPLKSCGERRLLEAGPDGVRVIHAERTFASTTLTLGQKT